MSTKLVGRSEPADIGHMKRTITITPEAAREAVAEEGTKLGAAYRLRVGYPWLVRALKTGRPVTYAPKKQRRWDRRDVVREAGGRCRCCGYDRCVDALELHAPGGRDLTPRAIRDWPWERVTAAIGTCVLLCANCHREVDAGVRACPPSPDC